MRDCNGCTACCSVNGIIELEKPIRTKCPHSCPLGCDRYETRPQSCHNFYCTWIRGYGTEEQRPDKLGVFAEERLDETLGRGFFVKEVTPGALEKPEVIRHLQALRVDTGKPVYVLDWDLKTAIGEILTPAEERKEIKKRRRRARK